MHLPVWHLPVLRLPVLPLVAWIMAVFLASGGWPPEAVAQERPHTPTEAILACWDNAVSATMECLERAADAFETSPLAGMGMGALCSLQYALDIFLCVPSRLISLAS